MNKPDLSRRDALLLKAWDGHLTASERAELSALADDDPVVAELIDAPHSDLAERIRADAALEPRGVGRAVQRTGVTVLGFGMLGLILAPLGAPSAVAGGLVLGGMVLALGPSIVRRVKTRDPYGTIDQ